jgi:hypothetical protein
MTKSYELVWNNQKYPIQQLNSESVKDSIMRELGWVFRPIMEETKSFENALDKINWKIVEKNY